MAIIAVNYSLQSFSRCAWTKIRNYELYDAKNKSKFFTERTFIYGRLQNVFFSMELDAVQKIMRWRAAAHNLQGNRLSQKSMIVYEVNSDSLLYFYLIDKSIIKALDLFIAFHCSCNVGCLVYYHFGSYHNCSPPNFVNKGLQS